MNCGDWEKATLAEHPDGRLKSSLRSDHGEMLPPLADDDEPARYPASAPKSGLRQGCLSGQCLKIRGVAAQAIRSV
jgi:hypothetical protein